MRTYWSIWLLILVMPGFRKINDAPGRNIGVAQTQDSVISRTLIINAFNANAMKARQGRKQLFFALADSVPVMLKEEMQRYPYRTVEVTGRPFMDIGQDESTIFRLLKENRAVFALVVRVVDIHFEQKEVTVTKDEGGTHRNANYDIYSVVQYGYYDTARLVKSAEVSVFHHFSTRSVMSGLFAAGPDITSNKEAAFSMLRENAAVYFRSFFPW